MDGLRLPNINGTDSEMIRQIRSYLYQLIPELQFALSNASESKTTSADKKTTPQAAVPSTISPAQVNPQITFEKILPLILKSGDVIVEEFSPEIKKVLEGEYVVVSDFGAYRDKTDQTITENSANTTLAFSRLMELSENYDEKFLSTDKSVEELQGEVQRIDTSAYIRVGLIDSITNTYGIEVGREDEVNGDKAFKAFARFTPSRLSFYDQSNTEVAYISDYKFQMWDAEILRTMYMGKFEEKVQSNGDVVVKWAGGDS